MRERDDLGAAIRDTSAELTARPSFGDDVAHDAVAQPVQE